MIHVVSSGVLLPILCLEAGETDIHSACASLSTWTASGASPIKIQLCGANLTAHRSIFADLSTEESRTMGTTLIGRLTITGRYKDTFPINLALDQNTTYATHPYQLSHAIMHCHFPATPATPMPPRYPCRWSVNTCRTTTSSVQASK